MMWFVSLQSLLVASVVSGFVLLLAWFVYIFCTPSQNGVDESPASREREDVPEDFNAQDKGLVELFHYQTERLNHLNTWRDAFILAFLVGYASLFAVGLKNTPAIESFLTTTTASTTTSITDGTTTQTNTTTETNTNRSADTTDAGPTLGGPAALICGIAGIVGLFVLRRLAFGRAHAVDTINRCTDLKRRLELSIGAPLPSITGHGPGQRFTLGSQCTSDMIVALLNALPFTAAIVLLHVRMQGSSLPEFAKEPLTVFFIWLAMVFAQLLAYTIWVETTPGRFETEGTPNRKSYRRPRKRLAWPYRRRQPRR